MLVFKTVQIALPLSTKIQLTDLVTAVKEASKLDPMLDSAIFRDTTEVLTVASILQNTEVANALKTHASLVAEIMLHAEVHMQHPIVHLLASVGGHLPIQNFFQRGHVNSTFF